MIVLPKKVEKRCDCITKIGQVMFPRIQTLEAWNLNIQGCQVAKNKCSVSCMSSCYPFLLYDLPHKACFQVVARWKTGAAFIGLPGLLRIGGLFKPLGFQLNQGKKQALLWGILTRNLKAMAHRSWIIIKYIIYLYICMCMHNIFLYGTVYVHHFITNRFLSKVPTVDAEILP